MKKFTIYNLQFTTKSKQELIRGMSLLEILIVVAIFAFLGIIVTGSVALSLRGGRKSESQVKVGENLNYAMSVIERQIRNANSIPDCVTNPDSHILNYTDQQGDATSFSCVNIGGADAHVASGSGRLTSDDVIVTSCSFICQKGASANPPSVNVFLEMRSVIGGGIQDTTLSSNSQILLRSY